MTTPTHTAVALDTTVRVDPASAGTAGPEVGRVAKVSGPVIEVVGLSASRLFDLVRVGRERLLGEVIRLDGPRATVQVFEDTTGLVIGEPVEGTGHPLTVELGPGLLGGIFDGIQRPLPALQQTGGLFVPRGSDPQRLDRARRWLFQPTVGLGDAVTGGDVLGTVAETGALTHRVLVPPGLGGRVTWLLEGEASVDEAVAAIDDRRVTMLQTWPVRTPRPVRQRLPLTTPLLTGSRILDTLFPVARGGAAIIPGGFGTGKTVLEQAVAKHSQADVVVYIGCGERGNELTEVLQEFPELGDPRSGAPLMDRTVLIANTSNMPVAARESSVYVGVTIAEYYRDQGYAVVLLADSTSRWGEALREVSSRLEEIPAEDGYPAYLATRLAGFYERSGAATCLGMPERAGSLTIIGAVSPAGGDFSEPVTQNSLRMTGCFWALDTTLARQRHFPSVNWNRSYAIYDLDPWYDQQVAEDWSRLRAWALAVLQEEGSLAEIVALLGIDAIAPAQRITLRLGRLLREDFLQQSSFDEIDASCSPTKQIAMLRTLHTAGRQMTDALERDVPVAEVVDAPVLARLSAMKRWTDQDLAPALESGDGLASSTADDLVDDLYTAFTALRGADEPTAEDGDQAMVAPRDGKDT